MAKCSGDPSGQGKSSTTADSDLTAASACSGQSHRHRGRVGIGSSPGKEMKRGAPTNAPPAADSVQSKRLETRCANVAEEDRIDSLEDIRYRIGPDCLALRSKRIGAAWQQLRVSAAMAIEWLRVCLRQGWLGNRGRHQEPANAPPNASTSRPSEPERDAGAVASPAGDHAPAPPHPAGPRRHPPFVTDPHHPTRRQLARSLGPPPKFDRRRRPRHRPDTPTEANYPGSTFLGTTLELALEHSSWDSSRVALGAVFPAPGALLVHTATG